MIDSSWLPNVEAAIKWYDKVIAEFPKTPAAERAYKGKLRTLLGWKESGRYGESYGVRENFSKYMPQLLTDFAAFEQDFPKASSLQAYRYQIAQAYWKNQDWVNTRQWLNKIIEVDIDFNPDILSTILYSYKDNLKIDEKGFTKWRKEKKGILIERSEEEIIALTRIGESQNLEYKLDVHTDNAKNEFIESIVSFSNTNQGTILIGVDDKGNIILDEDDNPLLECMCGNVLKGRFDPKLPHFTEKGSFWTPYCLFQYGCCWQNRRASLLSGIL